MTNKIILIFLLLFLPFACYAEPVELPMTVAATGKILVDIKIDGQPVTCIVDTGSPAFLLVDEAIADKENLEKIPVRANLRFFTEDAGGQTFKVLLKNVAIGSWEFSNVQALTIDDIRRATGTGYLNLPNFFAQGILGMGFLQQFHVKIDYGGNRLTLDPNYPLTHAPFGLTAPVAPVGAATGSRNFLLDTGSTFSVISSDALEPMGISYQTLSNADPLFKGTTQADTLQIGNVIFHDVTLEVADHFRQYAGRTALSGIIGYDLLKGMILDFDFPHHTIMLEKP